MQKFSTSELPAEIIQALREKGIIKPSEIQSLAIPTLLEHNGDFVGRSATGTGKTIAFGAPLLTKVDATVGKIQAVVLVPTRELSEQVGEELAALAQHIPNLKVQAIYGGLPIKTQVHNLSNGVQVLVATPGRLVDLIERNVVRLSTLKILVFDEADEMILKGFHKDIDRILARTDRDYATWLFSATMPDAINSIIKKYLNKELLKVLLGKRTTTNAAIDHWAVELEAIEKLNVLLYYLNQFQGQKGIIFCRTKSGVQKLHRQLSKNKFSCGAVHGDLPQGLRNKVMDQYRQGHINILIATDVASRGIDVEDVSFVIQYHVPDTKDAYTHRSGRTARAGKKGVNVTFIFAEEREKLQDIERGLNINIAYLPVPSLEEQWINKALVWGQQIAKEKPLGSHISKTDINAFKATLKHLSKDELLEKLLAVYLKSL